MQGKGGREGGRERPKDDEERVYLTRGRERGRKGIKYYCTCTTEMLPQNQLVVRAT